MEWPSTMQQVRPNSSQGAFTLTTAAAAVAAGQKGSSSLMVLSTPPPHGKRLAVRHPNLQPSLHATQTSSSTSFGGSPSTFGTPTMAATVPRPAAPPTTTAAATTDKQRQQQPPLQHFTYAGHPLASSPTSPTTNLAIDEAAARLLMLLKFPRSPTFGPAGTSFSAKATKGGKAGKHAKVLKLAAVGTPPTTGRFNRFRTADNGEGGGAVAGGRGSGICNGVAAHAGSPAGTKAPGVRKQRNSRPAVRAAARDLLVSIARGGKTPSPPTVKSSGGVKTPRSTAKSAAKRSPKSRTVGGSAAAAAAAGGGGGGGSSRQASEKKKARRSPLTVESSRQRRRSVTNESPNGLPPVALVGTGGVSGAAGPSGSSGAAHAAAAAAQSGDASFFIKGTQGQLDVCEYRTIDFEGAVRPYLLVRLRGQSNTLPNDASLSVILPPADGNGSSSVNVHFSRVRLKAGGLMYDYLQQPVTVPACSDDAGAAIEFEAPLLSSIFSKKCWQGMVVRGPRMFIAYIKDESGAELYQSVPMFVEISPTSNSPEYRDPVLEYTKDVLHLFFEASSAGNVYANAAAAATAVAPERKASSK